MAEFAPVTLTLPSLGPSLALEIIPFGLTIHRIFVQADGKTHDILVGPEKPEDHKTRRYINSVIGRYTNRLPVKPLQFERKGIKGELTPIPNESPRVSLHGGPIGFGDHWGFNLDASLGDLDVRGHNLFLAADHFAERDADALALGTFASAAGTPHAHTGKLIGEGYPPTGYDDYYLFKKDAVAPIPSHIPASEFTPEKDLVSSLVDATSPHSPLAILSSAKSGLKVRLDSNQHGTMFYSNCWSNPEKSGTRKKIHGGWGDVNTGDGYPPHTAVFLEFHHPLASFLIPENKDTDIDTLLTTGELYNNYVRAEISYTPVKA
ncbi:galactose mutarotase-like domain-containing protein [Schizophyllum commune]